MPTSALMQILRIRRNPVKIGSFYRRADEGIGPYSLAIASFLHNFLSLRAGDHCDSLSTALRAVARLHSAVALDRRGNPQDFQFLFPRYHIQEIPFHIQVKCYFRDAFFQIEPKILLLNGNVLPPGER